MANPKSKTLPMPGNAIADPDFYADSPTASRGTPRDDGNLLVDGTPSPPKEPGGGSPFKNLRTGK